MKKGKHIDLEQYKGLFFIIGLSFSLSILTIAFEWKTYEEKEADSWTYIEDYIDTLEVSQIIAIPKPKTSIPNLKPKLKKAQSLTPVKLNLTTLNEHNDEEINQSSPLDDLFDDLDEGDEIEKTVPLPFQPDLSAPQEKPFFINGKCKSLNSNTEKFNCSIEKIRERIKNNLYVPEYSSIDQEFLIKFKFDTTGHISNIQITGIQDDNIIKSAKRILSKLPPLTPAYHNGEKRVMKASIKVKIKTD